VSFVKLSLTRDKSRGYLHILLRWMETENLIIIQRIILFNYNNHRTHIALNKETPIPSVIYKPPDSKLVATPVLNGLYHTYSYKKVA